MQHIERGNENCHWKSTYRMQQIQVSTFPLVVLLPRLVHTVLAAVTHLRTLMTTGIQLLQ